MRPVTCAMFSCLCWRLLVSCLCSQSRSLASPQGADDLGTPRFQPVELHFLGLTLQQASRYHLAKKGNQSVESPQHHPAR